MIVLQSTSVVNAKAEPHAYAHYSVTEQEISLVCLRFTHQGKIICTAILGGN